MPSQSILCAGLSCLLGIGLSPWLRDVGLISPSIVIISLVVVAWAPAFFHTAFVQSIVNAYGHGGEFREFIWSFFLNKFILNFILKSLIELGH